MGFARAAGVFRSGARSRVGGFPAVFDALPGGVLADEILEEGPDRIRALVPEALSTRFAGHYRGYFGGMQREHARERRAKTMLYAYRVALTGIHLLETGEVEMDVGVTAPRYGFDVYAAGPVKPPSAKILMAPSRRCSSPNMPSPRSRAMPRSAGATRASASFCSDGSTAC